MAPSGPHSAFFYGTLMSPAVLHRVTGAPPTRPSQTTVDKQPYYTTCPALLPGHRRRRVLHADYPAVMPADATDSVRGTLVTGLSDNDIFRLDRFEGDEYRRQNVRVRLLPENHKTSVEKTRLDTPADTQEHAEREGEGEWADTQTYIWIAPPSQLEEQEWDFDEFVRTKMWRWSGGSEEFAAVDELDAGTRQEQKVDPTRGRRYFDGQREEELVRAAG